MTEQQIVERPRGAPSTETENHDHILISSQKYNTHPIRSIEASDRCIMGFVGANGAGKSTTLRILMGLVHQDAGCVKVLGHAMPEDQATAKREIGFPDIGSMPNPHGISLRSIYAMG